MLALLLAAVLQSAPPAAVLPPPAIPVIVWTKSDGIAPIIHLVLLSTVKGFAQPVEQTLYAKLYVAGRQIAIELHRLRGDVQVPPDGYATEDYTFAVPANMSGDAILSFNDDGQGYIVRVGREAGNPTH